MTIPFTLGSNSYHQQTEMTGLRCLDTLNPRSITQNTCKMLLGRLWTGALSTRVILTLLSPFKPFLSLRKRTENVSNSGPSCLVLSSSCSPVFLLQLGVSLLEGNVWVATAYPAQVEDAHRRQPPCTGQAVAGQSPAPSLWCWSKAALLLGQSLLL